MSGWSKCLRIRSPIRPLAPIVTALQALRGKLLGSDPLGSFWGQTPLSRPPARGSFRGQTLLPWEAFGVRRLLPWEAFGVRPHCRDRLPPGKLLGSDPIAVTTCPAGRNSGSGVSASSRATTASRMFGEQFVHGLALARAPGQRQRLGPVAAFLRLVDDNLQVHAGSNDELNRPRTSLYRRRGLRSTPSLSARRRERFLTPKAP